MDMNEINDIAQEILWKFEEDFNGGTSPYLSRRTSIVLALETYATNLDGHRLQQDFSLQMDSAEVCKLKKILLQCTEKYLNDNIKTLALG